MRGVQQRVTDLIPTSHNNCLRYYGTFSSNCSIRRNVVLYSHQEQLAIFPSEEKKKIKRKRTYLTWAALISRVFNDNPLRCPCGVEKRIVKFLTAPDECADYPASHGMEVLTADPKPARAPPGFMENDFEDQSAFEDYVEPEIPDELYVMDPPFYEEWVQGSFIMDRFALAVIFLSSTLIYLPAPALLHRHTAFCLQPSQPNPILWNFWKFTAMKAFKPLTPLAFLLEN